MRIPSKSQQQAIAHLSGPAMVIAGPGSGKTFTIVRRILSLICDYHIPPQNILVITYTRAAAAEMKKAEEAAAKRREEILAEAERDCEALKKEAGSRMGKAAQAILGRVVGN